jgi:heat shock protein HslJ
MHPAKVKYFRTQRWFVGFLLPLLISTCPVTHGDAESLQIGQPHNVLIGVVWKLLRFDDSKNVDSFAINASERYTLTLLPNGLYRVKADCNRMQGAYTLAEKEIKIKPGAATLAECGTDSKYAQYLRYLAEVDRWNIDGNPRQLALITNKGLLVFERDGSETP